MDLNLRFRDWFADHRYVVALVAVALALPQLFMFLWASFGAEAWVWGAFIDPSDPYFALLWVSLALTWGFLMLLPNQFTYQPQRQPWTLLGQSGVLHIVPLTTKMVLVVVLPMFATFFWMALWISGTGTNGETFGSEFNFWSSIYLTEVEFVTSVVITGIAAVLISVWLRPRLFGKTKGAMTAVATIPQHQPESCAHLSDRIVLEEDQECDSQRPTHIRRVV